MKINRRSIIHYSNHSNVARRFAVLGAIVAVPAMSLAGGGGTGLNLANQATTLVDAIKGEVGNVLPVVFGLLAVMLVIRLITNWVRRTAK